MRDFQAIHRKIHQIEINNLQENKNSTKMECTTKVDDKESEGRSPLNK